MMVSYLVGSNHISKTSTFPKIYEDAALLAKRKLDFEKKIGLMPGNPLVINKENCLAVMKDPLSFGSKSIDVVYLHVPNNKDAKNLTYENEHDNKSDADSYTNYLIEMSRGQRFLKSMAGQMSKLHITFNKIISFLKRKNY